MAWIQRSLFRRKPLFSKSSLLLKPAENTFNVIRDISLSRHICSQFYNSPDVNLKQSERNLKEDSVEDKLLQAKAKDTLRFQISGCKVVKKRSQGYSFGFLKDLQDLPELVKAIKETPNLSGEIAWKIFKIMNYFYVVLRSQEHWPEEQNFFKTSNEFSRVCAALEMHLPLLLPEDLVLVLRVALLYEVPPLSIFMQKTMRLILENINVYSPLQILSIYCNIMEHNFENSTLSESLKLAVLSYMAHCFKDKLSIDCFNDTKDLTTMINLAGKRVMPNFIVNDLLDEILKSKPKLLKPSLYSPLLKALLRANVAPKFLYQDALENILMDIKDNIGNWPFALVRSVADIYGTGCFYKGLPYKEDLFDAIALHAVEAKFSVTQACSIMKCLWKAPHLNYRLLLYICDEALVSNTENLTPIEIHKVIHVLAVSGFAQLKAVNLNFYKNKLESLIKSRNLRDGNFFRNVFTAIDLATLGIFDNDFINDAFDAEFSNGRIVYLGKDLSLYQNWILMLLHQTVFTLHPSYGGARIPDQALNAIFNSSKNCLISWNWQSTVEKIFGGRNYVLTNCSSSLYHVFSYVVILGPDNYPLNLSGFQVFSSPDTALSIDNIAVPSNCRVLIIQEFSKALRVDWVHYRNVPVVLGHLQLYIKVLEALGYYVIILGNADYEKLLEIERVPYLLDRVEQKCGKLGINIDKTID